MNVYLGHLLCLCLTSLTSSLCGPDFFFLRFFLIWTVFKVFIDFVTTLASVLRFGFWLRGLWDLSSPIRDQTCTPCIGRRSLNHGPSGMPHSGSSCTVRRTTHTGRGRGASQQEDGW